MIISYKKWFTVYISRQSGFIEDSEKKSDVIRQFVAGIAERVYFTDVIKYLNHQL
jgi:hypothetical protein